MFLSYYKESTLLNTLISLELTVICVRPLL